MSTEREHKYVSLADGRLVPPSAVPVLITPVQHRALVGQLWGLADEIGRLRRSCEAVPAWVLDRMGGQVEEALNITCHSMAELMSAGAGVHEAFEAVEARAERLRRALGVQV